MNMQFKYSVNLLSINKDPGAEFLIRIYVDKRLNEKSKKLLIDLFIYNRGSLDDNIFVDGIFNGEAFEDLIEQTLYQCSDGVEPMDVDCDFL